MWYVLVYVGWSICSYSRCPSNGLVMLAAGLAERTKTLRLRFASLKSPEGAWRASCRCESQPWICHPSSNIVHRNTSEAHNVLPLLNPNQTDCYQFLTTRAHFVAIRHVSRRHSITVGICPLACIIQSLIAEQSMLSGMSERSLFAEISAVRVGCMPNFPCNSTFPALVFCLQCHLSIIGLRE